jgi:hypothetical protein
MHGCRFHVISGGRGRQGSFQQQILIRLPQSNREQEKKDIWTLKTLKLLIELF